MNDDNRDSGTPDGERIAKRLARAGIASRRVAETMIADGRVSVNGRRISSPALNVGPDDRILVDGKPIAAPEPTRLWRYHKPAGLVTTERDEQGRPTIFENLPRRLPRVMSVGRLDLNSEGLLLLTNDGGLKRALELPSNGWERRYRARAFGNPDPARLQRLADGITVDGEQFGPIHATVEDHGGRGGGSGDDGAGDRRGGNSRNHWIEVRLNEGRNREVRRALDAAGLTVNRLIRTAYGPFGLEGLHRGAVVEVPGAMLRRAVRDIYRIRREDERG